MNFLKKLFGRRKKAEQEKRQECWYNNAHEKGEAVRSGMPVGAGGSENIFENATAQYVAQR